MCVSPLSIPNPYYGYSGSMSEYHDCVSRYIAVPCGYCPECIAVKQMSMVQRCQMESLSHRFYFCTLTYRPELLPVFECSTGYKIPYADFMHIDNMFHRLSDRYSYLRAVAVSEFGGLKGRPHFHVLFVFPSSMLPTFNDCLSFERELHDVVFDMWSINLGSKKNPYYYHLCEYHEKWHNGRLYRNYDLHFVNPSLTPSGTDDVAWYVLKYMLKPSDREKRLQQALRLNLSDSEYTYAWNLTRPKSWFPHYFGLNPEMNGRIGVPDWSIVQYLKDCIAKSPSDSAFPYYFNPDTGLSMPLSRYYSSKGWILNASDALRFYKNRDLYVSRSGYEALQSIHKLENTISRVDEHGVDSIISNLF